MTHPCGPNGYYPPPPPPRRPFSTTDVVVTSILAVGLLGVAAIAFVWSLFAMMATDGCGAPGKCDDGLIGFAYVVAWGGLGAALLVAVVGVSVAATKRKAMWIWPTVGFAVLVAAMVGGAFLLQTGVGG